MDQGEKEMITVYKHIEGPFEDEETGLWSGVFLAEEHEEPVHVELEFPSFDEYYSVLRQLHESKEPIYISSGNTLN
jgi:hypothetical protein